MFPSDLLLSYHGSEHQEGLTGPSKVCVMYPTGESAFGPLVTGKVSPEEMRQEKTEPFLPSPLRSLAMLKSALEKKRKYNFDQV